MRISAKDEMVRAKMEEMRRMYPFYDQLIDGLEAAGDGDEVPLLTQDRMNEYYMRGDGANHPEWNVYRTSGTSGGRRKSIYYDWIDEEAYVAQKAALFGRLLADGGRAAGNGKRVLSDMGTGHAEATAKSVFDRLGYQCESVPFGLPAAVHLLRFQQFKPQVLYTMPSLLDGLFRAAPADFAWNLEKVILVGEPAPPAWRKRAAERLGISERFIMDTYGSIEIGTIAYYDHLLERYVLLDGLAAEGVSPGQAGLADLALPEDEAILALTSYHRRRFPALRFVTYDVVRDLRSETDADGRTITTFEAIVKRVGSELKHGEKISIYDIENAVFKHIGEAEVRVAVTGNRLEVLVFTSESVDGAKAAEVRAEVHSAIPEIGAMIRGGLLEEMKIAFIHSTSETDAAAKDQSLQGAVPIKRKKLYLQKKEESGNREGSGQQ
ncbi:CoF synthetase [Paenibacillus sp. NEAU-GSW1]|uniref:CoF synthetase n=1 Tax=Paenibacillus sp. NEAU-GSW1 TaxID=2682486 RepID=UPI0012E2F1F1|nr:CoF synthetase [Paenibacillus sp. NEAU-GSW1]MUT67803.1 CoF synthetase [Paenibacillus sp. NEAU-GSW1]